MMAGILHVLGVDSVSSNWYALWSGIAGDVGSFVVLFGVVGLLRKHNCHVKGCHRVGRLVVHHENGTYTVCAKHHPTGAPRAADLKEGTNG